MISNELFRDIFYLTPQQVKEISNIEKDVSDEKISMIQVHVEIFYINTVLGDDLAYAVKQEIFNVTTGGTLSQRVTDLLEYINPAEAYAVAYELIPFLTMKITRSGAVSMQPNNANPLTLEEMSYIRRNYQELLYAYVNRMKKFLEDNLATYPEYEKMCKPNKFYNSNGSTGLMFY